MSADVQTFPQDEVTRRRGELTMIEVIEGARSPEEMMSLLAAAFPKATMGEVRQAIQSRAHSLREEAEKARREAGTLERVEAVAAQDADRGDETSLGESLTRLAGGPMMVAGLRPAQRLSGLSGRVLPAPLFRPPERRRKPGLF